MIRWSFRHEPASHANTMVYEFQIWYWSLCYAMLPQYFYVRAIKQYPIIIYLQLYLYYYFFVLYVSVMSNIYNNFIRYHEVNMDICHMILVQDPSSSLAGYYKSFSNNDFILLLPHVYSAFYVNKGHTYNISTFTNNDSITKIRSLWLYGQTE